MGEMKLHQISAAHAEGCFVFEGFLSIFTALNTV
jgi:hypothetical protein